MKCILVVTPLTLPKLVMYVVPCEQLAEIMLDMQYFAQCAACAEDFALQSYSVNRITFHSHTKVRVYTCRVS